MAGWLTVAAVMVASGAGFTAVGHAVALILGMMLSTRLRGIPGWNLLRLGLLAVGVAFGLLLLVGVSLPIAPLAVAAGTAAIPIALWVTRRRGALRVGSSYLTPDRRGPCGRPPVRLRGRRPWRPAGSVPLR